MAIVSVNFNKINSEKIKAASGKIGVNNNVALKSLEKTDSNVSAGNTALKVQFNFMSTYDPEVAKIEMEGELVMLETDAKANEYLKEWGKSNQLPQEAMIQVYNAVMHKCFTMAIMITKELNLPAPIRFPRVTEKITEQLSKAK